jgi:hypothetical protein
MLRTRIPIPIAYILIVLLVVVGGMFVFGTVYVKRTAEAATRESNQQWCELIVTLDDTYRSVPATTPTGRVIAFEMGQLRKAFNCTPRGPLPPVPTPTR